MGLWIVFFQLIMGQVLPMGILEVNNESIFL